MRQRLLPVVVATCLFSIAGLPAAAQAPTAQGSLAMQGPKLVVRADAKTGRSVRDLVRIDVY